MIKMVTVQTRECIEGDPGEAMRGYYKLSGDMLVMCSEDGRQSGKPVKLQPGDDARVIACRLLRQEMLKQPTSRFDRRIVYPKLGLA